jgi:hypothetical protein
LAEPLAAQDLREGGRGCAISAISHLHDAIRRRKKWRLFGLFSAILPELRAAGEVSSHDASTNGLVNEIKRRRRPG